MPFENPDLQNPEQYRLLIEVVEAAINAKERDFLRDAPYRIHVDGLAPAQGSEIYDRIRLELAAEEFILYEQLQPQSTSISFTYPSPDGYPALDSFEQRWTNGISWVYAHLSDGPIGYASQDSRIVGEVQRFMIDDTDYYLESLGLNPVLLSDHQIDPDNVEQLMSLLITSARNVHFYRQREVLVDTKTSLRTVHEARIINDGSDIHPVQELRLEVTHFNDMLDHYHALCALDLPTTFPVFENHIVFVRDNSESRWQYKASYEGPIEPGWLLGEEYNKDVSNLTLPELNLFAKALSALEQPEG